MISSEIRAFADGNFASNDVPGRLEFHVAPDNGRVITGNPDTARITIKSDGKVGIGTFKPSGSLDVFGDGLTSQVFILSGSGAKTSHNEKTYSDLAFFVSGAIDSKQTSTKGLSLFGGDMHISGALHGGGSLVEPEPDRGFSIVSSRNQSITFFVRPDGPLEEVARFSGFGAKSVTFFIRNR